MQLELCGQSQEVGALKPTKYLDDLDELNRANGAWNKCCLKLSSGKVDFVVLWSKKLQSDRYILNSTPIFVKILFSQFTELDEEF